MPHSTTFQKASRKPLARELAQLLLGETVKRVSGRRKSVEHAAIVSTGLEFTVTSNYFVNRRVRAGTPWKTVTYPVPFPSPTNGLAARDGQTFSNVSR